MGPLSSCINDGGTPLTIRVFPPLYIKSAQLSSKDCSGKRPLPLRLHSQTVRMRQPRPSSASSAIPSRTRVAAIFPCQNSRLVSGMWNIGQSWPCQKQPCIKTTTPWRGKTKSGRPGSVETFNRYRRPRACRPRRISISGLVLRPMILLMFSRRCSMVSTSVNYFPIQPASFIMVLRQP